jgi:hypothetical protein
MTEREDWAALFVETGVSTIGFSTSGPSIRLEESLAGSDPRNRPSMEPSAARANAGFPVFR